MRTSVNEPVPFYAALRRPITAFAHELHDCVLRHAYGGRDLDRPIWRFHAQVHVAVLLAQHIDLQSVDIEHFAGARGTVELSTP